MNKKVLQNYKKYNNLKSSQIYRNRTHTNLIIPKGMKYNWGAYAIITGYQIQIFDAYKVWNWVVKQFKFIS